MDLREIIKWFIPCFHILLKMDTRMLFILLLFFCSICPSLASFSEESSHLNSTKNISFHSKLNQSEVIGSRSEENSSIDNSVGRTFGRPMKRMIQALVPLAMAIGSAGTWAVVAALIGAKTLLVTLVILKLLLMAGAAKFGGLIASKTHHQPHYAPAPSKEIHLHIHNSGHGHHEEEVIPNISSWSRDSPPPHIAPKTEAEVYNPYLYLAGPQTIKTPYGNYVKVD